MEALNQGTAELAEEMAVREAENPGRTARIGNFGFLELESSWGDEATIVNTARISATNRRLDSLDDFSERDRELLYHLLRDNHGTPFETVYFRWRFIAPIFVLRQWVKHRISSWNEFSQRYRKPISMGYVPDLDARSVDGFPVLSEAEVAEYEEKLADIYRWYEDVYERVTGRIEAAREAGDLPPKEASRDPYRGRARELLRNIMPVATYSDVYWTVNFRSLMNFFNLRTKPDAQYEIRQYAVAAYDMVRASHPLLMETMDRVLAEKGG